MWIESRRFRRARCRLGAPVGSSPAAAGGTTPSRIWRQIVLEKRSASCFGGSRGYNCKVVSPDFSKVVRYFAPSTPMVLRMDVAKNGMIH